MASAHPMGNFSINQHTGIHLSNGGCRLTYLLDFAEIPTVDLLTRMSLPTGARVSPEALQAAMEKMAGEWMSKLELTVDGETVGLVRSRTTGILEDGESGLPVLKVHMDLEGPWKGGAGTFSYVDHNYEDRIGWKEVVVDSDTSIAVKGTNPYSTDRSAGLTVYPDEIASTWPSVQKAVFQVTPDSM